MNVRPGIVAGAVALVLVAGVAVASAVGPVHEPVGADGSGGSGSVATQPVTASTLVCPSVPAPGRSTTAIVSAAAPAGPGVVALSRIGAAANARPLATAPPSPPALNPYLVYNTERNRGGGMLVRATSAAARGLTAIGLVRTVAGVGRALASMPCTSAGPETWLVGGAATSGRRDVLFLSNPEAAEAVVDVTIYTDRGAVLPSRSQGVTVPPGGQVALALDALVPGAANPVVQVATRSGRVAAGMVDTATSGTIPQGQDWVPPAAAPSLRQVVTGIPTDPDARRRLTVLVPGSEDAQVSIKLSTAEGTLTPDGLQSLVVPAGVPYVVDLAKAGVTVPYTVTVESDQPTVAGVRSERGGRAGQLVEFSYGASALPMAGSAAVLPLAGRDNAVATYLLLTASGDSDVEVQVTQYDRTGRAQPSSRFTVLAGRMVALRVGLPKQGYTPVLVETSGESPLVVGWVLTVQGPRGPLLTGGPLLQTPLETPVTPVAPDPEAGLPGR